MTEYTIGKAKVRVHGSPDPDRLREETLKFLKAAERQRKKVRNEARTKANSQPAQVDSIKGS